MSAEPRVTVVVLTHNRPRELAHCLQQLSRLPERPAIVVVDNGSDAASVEPVVACFPALQWVRLQRNLGAAGRNAGVARVRTPYVAFCDDDTWWQAGALQRAAELLDADPRLAALSARVLVGPEQRLDATCERMAASPLDARGLPGPALIGFMAGAAVMRCAAYREVGGYEPRFFIGAEEALMGLDLAAGGWRMAYAAQLVTHHHPSPTREAAERRLVLLRNRLWLPWLRLPLRLACDETRRVLREAAAHRLARQAAMRALRGLPWLMARRRVVPAPVCEMWLAVHRGAAPPRASGAAVRLAVPQSVPRADE